MIEWPLIFVGGLLGSSHCVGMCGGFALTVGLGARRVSENLRRQLLYSLGRVGTYSFCGLCAGFAGVWLQRRTGLLISLQATLSIVAGLVLGWQGLRAIGWLPGRSARVAGAPACLAGGVLGPLLTAPRGHQVLLAGVANGFLPCGLVYGYLALAASTGDLGRGLLTMSLFGAGTVPVMVLVGAGASLRTHAAPRFFYRAAAWCVLVTGLLSVARGLWSLRAGGAPHCPGCAVTSVIRLSGILAIAVGT